MEIMSLVYFFYFPKAFDPVDHNILLQKFDFCGIKGVTYNWFEDYLRERKQYVTCNAITSNMELIKCHLLLETNASMMLIWELIM